MKRSKIIIIWACAIGVFGAITCITSPESAAAGGVALMIAAAILAVYAIRGIWGSGEGRRDREQSAAELTIDGAEKYYKDKVKQGDAYYYGKTCEADDYYSKRSDEAEAFYQKKAKEADNYTAQQEAQIQAERRKAEEYTAKLKAEQGELQTDLQALKEQVAALQSDTIVGMTQISDYDGMKSDEIKNKLAMLRIKQDEAIKSGTALVVTNGSGQKRVVDSQMKQILRCFNAETANIISAVTVKNVDSSRAKIQRSFDTINKIFQIDGVQLSQDYLATKFEELSLVYAYMVREEEEREQRRAIREQMVEEEKVRREIERQKQKLDKEISQFTAETNRLMGYLQKAKDDVERKLYVDKIEELQKSVQKLQADKEDVIHREQNTRAGFVYIISNIGSFGERVFKIGMTRRLEPMDRIAELSSASVPFPFDVHAMIFSDDAPGLEAVLHQHFDANRVNKVNPRKEFFRVDLDAIKQVVLANHNATVKFIEVPDATEYRESLRVAETAAV